MKNTTILADLTSINTDMLSYNEGRVDTLSMIERVKGKPGLDDIDGKYLVNGAVITGNVSVRTNNNTNVATGKIGYSISRVALDEATGKALRNASNEPMIVETMNVTQDECVNLARVYGIQNGFIKIRKSQLVDKVSGDFLKYNTTTYIQPSPPKAQAFTKDTSLVFVYKTDSANLQVVPYELAVAETDCTPNLWRLLASDYEKKKKKNRKIRDKKQLKTEQANKTRQIKQAIIDARKKQVPRSINPFRDTDLTK